MEAPFPKVMTPKGRRRFSFTEETDAQRETGQAAPPTVSSRSSAVPSCATVSQFDLKLCAFQCGALNQSSWTGPRKGRLRSPRGRSGPPSVHLLRGGPSSHTGNLVFLSGISGKYARCGAHPTGSRRDGSTSSLLEVSTVFLMI